MKSSIPLKLAASVLLFSMFSLKAAPVGTSLTYQGRLNDGAIAANGIYDLQFGLYDAATFGTSVAGSVTNSAVGITNGLFTVALDFGSAVFDGNARWLEIAVRTNGSTSFATLQPRQPLTATPYAIAAGYLNGMLPATQLSGVVPITQLPSTLVTNNASGLTLSGTFVGNGTGVTNVNAASLSGLTAPAFWQVTGNNVSPGQFLGSANNQAVEIRVNNTRALRLEPLTPLATHSNTVNLVGGSPLNMIASTAYGSVIAGGGGNFWGYPFTNSIFSDWSFLGGGYANTIKVGAIHSVLGGGYLNTIHTNAEYSVMGGGAHNDILTDAAVAFVGGGSYNVVQPYSIWAVIGGGYGNTIGTNSANATIVGGNANAIESHATESFIGGGRENRIRPDAGNSFLGGGYLNEMETIGSFLGGGVMNSVGPGAYYSFLGAGYQNALELNARYSFVGAGYRNTIKDGYYSFIGGGYSNVVSGAGAVVVGGGWDGSSVNGNVASGAGSAIVGGTQNLASGSRSSVAGGHNNAATSWYATVPGGAWNVANGQGSFAAGRAAKSLHDGSFVWNDASDGDFLSTGVNQFDVHANGGIRFVTSSNIVGGADCNLVDDGYQASFIGGGGANNWGGSAYTNRITANFGVIGGGGNNNISTNAGFSTIGGGNNNSIQRNATYASIGGGSGNSVRPSATYSAISGGSGNTIQTNASYGTISGGRGNSVGTNNLYASIGGGYYNFAGSNAPYSTVPGGREAMTSHYGQMAHASGRFSLYGDAQGSAYVLRISSSGTSAYTLALDGDTSSNFLTIPTGARWAFDILVIGSQTGGAAASFQIKGAIRNDSGTVAFIGTPSVTSLGADAGASTWTASVQANNTTDSLDIVVHGSGPGWTQWVANTRTVEVTPTY